MKYIIPIIILSVVVIFSYPIKSLRDHIKSGNIDYVERYFKDLSEREISHSDFQFLTSFILTDGKLAQNQFSKLNISDLSGHLAPILLYKKGNQEYLNNDYNSAIKSFKKLKKLYNKSNYIAPAISMMINAYLQLGHIDSAKSIRIWSNSNIKLDFVENSKKLNQIIDKSKDKYTIQLGAYGKRNNANIAKEKIKEKGYYSRVEEIIVKGKTLYAVRYGSFQTEEEARKIQNKLKQNHSVNSYLKKIN